MKTAHREAARAKQHARDVFDNEVPLQWRQDLFELIGRTPHLDWLLLTKRIGNAKTMMADALSAFPPANHDGLIWPLPNVWLGATICDQAEADRDIPKLLATPAARRFLSMEPLLGPVDVTPFLWGKHERVDTICQNCPRDADCECGYHTRKAMNMAAIDWIIVGGESGPHARPMHPEWARSLRDQCVSARVPFLFKQWGEWVPRSDCYHRFEDGTSCDQLDPGARRWPCVRLTERGHNGRDLAHAGEGDDAYMQRVGKKMAGRLLDGRTWDEVPA